MTQVIRSSRIERIKRPAWALEANFYVPIGDEERAFGFPAFGPKSYNAAVREALDNGQRLPTGKQTAFMLDEAYNSTNRYVQNSPEAQFVRGTIMRDGVLWVPNVNIWTPMSIRSPGLYTVFDENGQGLVKVYTTEELEDLLSKGSTERGVRFSQDRKVAFAPLNTIKAENHDKGTLAYDGAFIANHDVEGAEKLDQVAEKFFFNPYSRIVVNTTNKPIQGLSALGGSGDLVDGRLLACFDSSGGDGCGYVVSVSGSSSSAEGTAPKN